jgi:hypothetical protein
LGLGVLGGIPAGFAVFSSGVGRHKQVAAAVSLVASEGKAGKGPYFLEVSFYQHIAAVSQRPAPGLTFRHIPGPLTCSNLDDFVWFQLSRGGLRSAFVWNDARILPNRINPGAGSDVFAKFFAKLFAKFCFVFTSSKGLTSCYRFPLVFIYQVFTVFEAVQCRMFMKGSCRIRV